MIHDQFCRCRDCKPPLPVGSNFGLTFPWFAFIISLVIGTVAGVTFDYFYN